MGILLGNLTTKQLEERLSITLTDEKRNELESMRQDEASNIEKNKWHCFDIPLNLACGSMETATKVCEILKPYSSQMSEQLQISVGK